MAEDAKTDETPETPASEAEVVSPAAPETGEETPEPVAAAEDEASTLAEEGSPASADVPTADEPTAQTQPEASAKRKPRKRLPRAQRLKKTRPKRETSAERKPIVRTPKPETLRGRRQERRGVVVSDAMDKTIVVKVEAVRAHQRYKKVIRRSVKFHAHDEQNQAHVGDRVRIIETRPLSKTKHWRLAEVLEAAK
jgi:small subunit ribosomal protein S17